LKRSLENARSRSAIEFYFSDAAETEPEWQFDHLLAWLHAVLQNVIREERNRVGYWREVNSRESNGHCNLRDASPDPLQTLIRNEVADFLRESFKKLDRGQREALQLRAKGWKYGEIADRLGVNENTVATWISRGTRMLGRLLKSRIGARGRDARWGL
jgi:RNA polymerase sigma factor (sigma-70 family)